MSTQDILAMIARRLREPSTYASLAALFGLLHISADPGLQQNIADIGMGVAAAIGIFLREGPKHITTTELPPPAAKE